jgi:hypothetical protein
VSESRELVIVVGSGRSGTSLFASILRELGYKIPKPEVPADATNPAGFGEPQWLVDFHTATLRKARVQTSDARPAAWGLTARWCFEESVTSEARDWLSQQFAGADHVLLKDPRILWFTTLWETVAEDLEARVKYVTLLRPPADTVKSKDRWYAMSLTPTNRAAGWINTMLYTERATRGKVRTYVAFERLVADWAAAVGAADDVVGLPVLRTARSSMLAAAQKLVDPSLPVSSAGWESLGVSPAISDLADRVWKMFSSLLEVREPDEEAYESLDSLRAEYRALYRTAEEIAHSSVIAASRGDTTSAASSPAPPPVAEAAAAAQPPAAKTLSLRVARLVPESVRHALPLRARKKLVRLLP